jgi:hypothetical protein
MSTIEKKAADDETETEREREKANFKPLYDYENDKQNNPDRQRRDLDPTTHSVDNCDIFPSNHIELAAKFNKS